MATMIEARYDLPDNHTRESFRASTGQDSISIDLDGWKLEDVELRKHKKYGFRRQLVTRHPCVHKAYHRDRDRDRDRDRCRYPERPVQVLS